MTIATTTRRFALALSAGLVSTTDKALAGCGVAMAGSSAIFSGYMLLHADHAPRINGIEHLAIFAQPNLSKRTASLRAAVDADAGEGADLSPTGSIGPRSPNSEESGPTSVKPLETTARPSRDTQAEIRWNGQWIAPDQVRGASDLRAPQVGNRFNKKLIFGDSEN